MTESGPRVAVFAASPTVVCTFEHADDGEGGPDVALEVGGQGPWAPRAVRALGTTPVLVVPLGGDTGCAADKGSASPDPALVDHLADEVEVGAATDGGTGGSSG